MRTEVYMAEDVIQPVATQEATTPTVEVQPSVSVEEFNAIKAKLEEYEASFQTKVNQASKAESEKYEKQLQKATLTTEERLKQEAQEQIEALSGELNTLKIEKKQFTIKQLLAEAKLTPLFANDVRLVNADIADIPSVVKALTKEYADYQEQYGKPAVGGTAPKTPQTTSQNNSLIDQLVNSNPTLAQYLKPKR